MATPGQQFADWNSISSDGNGILGALAAYGVDKSGLGDYLNSKMPQGMGIKSGKVSYSAPPPTSVPSLAPVPPTSVPPVAPSVAPVDPTQPDDSHINLGKQMLNLSSWDDSSNGTGLMDKIKLATLMG